MTTDQIHKNKRELLDEIGKLCNEPISVSAANQMVLCKGAYETICLFEREIGKSKENTPCADTERLSDQQIKHWMEHLENDDGTTGPHYTKDQIEQYKRSLGLDCTAMELYAATNMIYSDYCRVLQKYGVNRIEVYMELAQAFLHDKDAGAEDKLAAYYECIVEGK